MNLNEIIRTKKIVFGYREVKKKLLKGNTDAVVIAKNCPWGILKTSFFKATNLMPPVTKTLVRLLTVIINYLPKIESRVFCLVTNLAGTKPEISEVKIRIIPRMRRSWGVTARRPSAIGRVRGWRLRNGLRNPRIKRLDKITPETA